MSPEKHLVVGAAGGIAVLSITGNIPLAAGFFLGSWMIDLDHLWLFWVETKWKRIFDMKGMVRYHSKDKLNQFIKRPFLHLLPFHTLELLLVFLFLAQNPIILGALWGMMLHFLLDDVELYRLSGISFFKRCHSVLEYYFRRCFLKEKNYQDLYPALFPLV